MFMGCRGLLKRTAKRCAWIKTVRKSPAGATSLCKKSDTVGPLPSSGDHDAQPVRRHGGSKKNTQS